MLLFFDTAIQTSFLGHIYNQNGILLKLSPEVDQAESAPVSYVDTMGKVVTNGRKEKRYVDRGNWKPENMFWAYKRSLNSIMGSEREEGPHSRSMIFRRGWY